MRCFALSIVCLLICVGRLAAQQAPPTAPDAPPAIDSKEAATIASYGIGINTGRSIRSDGVNIDLDAFCQGIRDGAGGAQAKYTDEQIRAAVAIFQRQMQAQQQQKRQEQAEKNKQEGQAFLARNANKQGVTTLPSGLQYQVIKQGNGATPKATDTVTVHYEGTLLDGTVFDSSLKRNQPATFQVNGVIPGWTEALQRMHVGDKWRIFVPAELGYGARGAGGVIGPNAVLIFDVELLGIGEPGPGTPE